MKKLADEYKRTLKALNKRITELRKQREEVEDEKKVNDINNRLSIFYAMQRDVREVEKEVRHYYDKGWWRSEKYTCNSR